MRIDEIRNKLLRFRQGLYSSFHRSADATMNLIDALSSNDSAQSVAELSLNPSFQRNYNSVYRSIANFSSAEYPEKVTEITINPTQERQKLIASTVPSPEKRSFYLLATDVTPQPRQFAETMSDRTVVYSPNPILNNKPITIGHQYSVLVALPEAHGSQSKPWIIPLSVQRVSSEQNGVTVGSNQLGGILENKELLFHDQLCVHVGDGAYSKVEYIMSHQDNENLVQISRIRNNRVLYFPAPQQPKGKRSRGRPKWYGDPFRLKDQSTWSEPQEVEETTHVSTAGKTYTVQLKSWNNLFMRGKVDLPTHKVPLKLVRIEFIKSNGTPLYKRPLWTIVVGKRRNELSLKQIWESYRQRYDIEHFFRFGKQRMLMDKYQTPELQHEENWWQMVSLAYTQLWIAAPLAEKMPRPWEKFDPSSPESLLSPSQVQRDFGRIIQQIGTPARFSKPRGKSPGRQNGQKQASRIKQKVKFKGKYRKFSQKKAA